MVIFQLTQSCNITKEIRRGRREKGRDEESQQPSLLADGAVIVLRVGVCLPWSFFMTELKSTKLCDSLNTMKSLTKVAASQVGSRATSELIWTNIWFLEAWSGSYVCIGWASLHSSENRNSLSSPWGSSLVGVDSRDSLPSVDSLTAAGQRTHLELLMVLLSYIHNDEKVSNLWLATSIYCIADSLSIPF